MIKENVEQIINKKVSRKLFLKLSLFINILKNNPLWSPNLLNEIFKYLKVLINFNREN